MSLVGLLVAVLAIGFVATGYAAEAAKAVTVTGQVKAVTGVAGCVATVTVHKEGGMVAYNVVDDEIGKKLAKEADGKRAEIKGTVETKDKIECLTVTEFRVLPAPAKKE
jgi:hypothetical protein